MRKYRPDGWHSLLCFLMKESGLYLTNLKGKNNYWILKNNSERITYHQIWKCNLQKCSTQNSIKTI